MKTYEYAILKENYPELGTLSTVLENKYENKKFALIIKRINVKLTGGSESVQSIIYSDDLLELSNKAQTYISWYNYTIGLTKNIQGYITQI